MIIIKSQKELQVNLNRINKSIIDSVKFDIETIENNYEEINVNYGPYVVLVNEDEEDALLTRFPYLDYVESEGEEVIYKNQHIEIVRDVYLISEYGLIIYKERNV